MTRVRGEVGGWTMTAACERRQDLKGSEEYLGFWRGDAPSPGYGDDVSPWVQSVSIAAWRNIVDWFGLIWLVRSLQTDFV